MSRRAGSPPYLHPRTADKGALRVHRSPTPMRLKSASRSPRRDVRDGSGKPDVRDRHVKFEDEMGKPLEYQMEPSTGRFKALRQELPRKDGESRSMWKSRMMTHLANKESARKK